jgi:RNA polymerase sigma-70 factor (ECF subfamily)
MARLDPQALVTHIDRLYRVAWALCGSRDEAEDLVQETAARVLARPRQLHGQDDLAYLVRALRNTFLLSRRTRSRRPHEVATLEQIEPIEARWSSSAGRPESALEARELFAAIAGLPEDFRLALVAVDVAGLSYREAADLLDTREATIASRVYRARERVAGTIAPLDEHGEARAPARSLR